MIISEIQRNPTKQQGINLTQQINICCDDSNCLKKYKISYLAQKICFNKYNKDLCRGCQQKEQYKSGIRSKNQCYKAGKAYKEKYEGKSWAEIYGKEKSIELKNKQSKRSSGINNPNFNGIWHGIHPSINQKGKTLEEIYGIEKSNIIKNKISKFSSGKNNPMYGKPAPNGSGNGWSGWYKGWHFRSIHELSYMINVIERFKMKWESVETKKFRIPYINFDGKSRTYRADFLINEKYLIEIKPKKLWNSKNILLKKEAAINFCKKKNLIYKLIDPSKLLSNDDIKELINTHKLKFLDRYDKKFQNLIN